MRTFSKALITIALLVGGVLTIAQERELNAVRISEAPKIDGNLDDAAWENVPVATDFIQFRPNPDESASQKTEIKVVYDNNAIYFGAKMYDDPSLILKELGQRDQFNVNADRLAIVLDTFNDDQNGFGFFVTAAGVQLDLKFSEQGREDSSWDAVWESNVKIVEDGWIAEIKVPYYAIRFPKTDVQDWGLNFVRVIRRDREEVSWNRVDVNQAGFINQSGKLTGVTSIDPPVRLNLSPFISTNIGRSTGSSTEADFNAGMDLKYGLNESFTLDMTLIPDFGGVRSDEQILNLGPFEQVFNENRAFFTEGTELFSKNNLFYSRRIGQLSFQFDPYSDLGANEEVTELPGRTKLLNATKISGRTKNGLGIGVFNAFTDEATALVVDSVTNESREALIDPFTNYNIVVFDQTLKNSSSINLINTNVARAKNGRDANVTGVGFRINDKNVEYGVEGNFNLSQIFTQDSVFYQNGSGTVFEKLETNNNVGFSSFIEGGKISGTFNYGGFMSVESDEFDRNDLGLLFTNNQLEYGLWGSYNVNEPTNTFQNYGIRANTWIENLYQPSLRTAYAARMNAFATFKNFNNMWVYTVQRPEGRKDFFEPRQGDFETFFQRPDFGWYGMGFSSDYRKTFAFDTEIEHGVSNGYYSIRVYNAFIAPRIRFSDKVLLRGNYNYNSRPDDIGYVDEVDSDVIMGERDRLRQNAGFDLSYKFNENMNLNLNNRYVWDKGSYENFYNLRRSDGQLDLNPEYTAPDFNFSAYNLDAIFNWRFAPGSDVFLVYKKQISDFQETTRTGFFNNFGELLDADQTDVINLKVSYFIDYNTLRKNKKPKS
ncbi:MAG: carbohydrate binding family 9 domain-containing protein [Saprospiraceae bacterium]|nr:carbohydrate binding family 9 domain-containing protein [Saprospiraceae bacterium]